MKIGYRTIKTAIGVPIAILIAQLFGLTNFTSAGIVTILCIQSSRRRSFISASDRFIACMIAIVCSFILFEILGYYPIVIGIILILFIPITVFLNITQAIASSSVIILNLYSTGDINLAAIGSQLLIVLIGIGTALVLNLYMPSMENKLKEHQVNLEGKIQRILSEIALYIRDKNTTWDGKELIDAEEILEKATSLVAVDKENKLLRNEHTFYDYFQMRTKQFELLRRMIPLVSKIDNVDLISEKIASFFEGLSKAVHPGNTAIIFLEQLHELRELISKKDLPTTREEFEIRANLFQLLQEIEDYLIVKNKFKMSDVSILKIPKRKKIKKKTGKS